MSAVVNAGVTPNNILAPGGLNVGDLMLFLVSTPGNGKGSGGTSDAQTAAAVAEITGLPTNTQINFAAGDALNFNQTGANSLAAVAAAYVAGTTITVCRLNAVTYFLQVPPAGGTVQTVRLMRQVNGLNAVPVADNIINLQFSYDVINSVGGTMSANQSNPIGAGLSPALIQKVNMWVMGQSLVSAGKQYQSMYLASSTSAGNMSFCNSYSSNSTVCQLIDLRRGFVCGLRGKEMNKRRRDSRGFTLIAALLLTLLLSAMAVGLIYLVNNEQRMGGNDLEGNLAYYGAESGIENLTAQISQLYQSSQTPTAAALTALASPANYPTAVTGSNITGMNYVESITWPSTQTNGLPCPNLPNPCGAWDIVGSGPDQGMVASLIPFNLQVTATRASGAGEATSNAAITPTGASVNLTRTVEVALLPAFEFGVFCDGDCDYFAGPNFNFGGRVHTNGNLFLASGAALTFTDKIAAVGNIVLDRLENGHLTSSGYGGSVYAPSAAGGCPAAPGAGPAANCPQLTAGSWSGGIPTGAGGANAGWTGISTGTFHNFVINGLTGATSLQLPFVNSSQIGAIDIVRRPQATDTTLLTNSRLYSEAEIRILLADDISQLHPERSAGVLDPNDVQLGVPSTAYFRLSGTPNTDYMYYGEGKTGTGSFIKPTGCAGSPWPLLGQVTWTTPCQSVWLRVEYLNNANQWIGVTQEWLGYGFGRLYGVSPSVPYSSTGAPPAGANQISPAILILQQLQSGKAATSGYETPASGTTQYNWIPINFYDSREGEPRDTRSGGTATNVSPDRRDERGRTGCGQPLALAAILAWHSILWRQRTLGKQY